MRKLCLIIAFLYTVFNMNIMSVNVEKLKKRRESIKQQLKSIKEKQKENKDKIAAEGANLTNLNIQIQVQNTKLDNLYKNIESLVSNINDTTVEITKLEKNIDGKKDLFAKRIRAMYVMGNVSYLSVLLNSRDIHEALTNTSMMQMILESDKRLIKQIADAKLELERKKEELEANKVALDDERSKEEQAKKNLQDAINAKNAYIAELKNNEAKFIAEQKKMQQDDRDLEAKIMAAQQYNEGNYGGGRLGWPIPGHSRVSSPFGYRTLYGRKDFHTGTDFPAPVGTNIVAAEEGRVTHAGWLGSYGQLVVISHGKGISTAYAHCSSILVRVGQVVNKGQVVAKVGNTGNSTGPHLHFEVRVNGKATNAMGWIR